MKRRSSKRKPVLANQRGESLVESIVSLVIFSILLTSISMVISVSLNLTAGSLREGTAKQDLANRVILEEYYGSADTVTLVLRGNNGINVSLPVKLSNDGTFIAFVPEVTSP